LWGAILKEDRGMSKKHAGGGSHAKNQRQLALARTSIKPLDTVQDR
jgi:hypothetical protein